MARGDSPTRSYTKRVRSLAWPLRRFIGVARFNGSDAVVKRLLEHAFADGPEHESEHLSFEVLALTDHDRVDVGAPVGPPREGIGVAGCASHTFESVVAMTTRLGSDQS